MKKLLLPSITTLFIFLSSIGISNQLLCMQRPEGFLRSVPGPVARAQTYALMYNFERGKELSKLSGPVFEIAYSKDGKQLLTVASPQDDKVIILDPVTGEERLRLEAGNIVESTMFSPDSRTILVRTVTNLSLWNTQTGDQVWSIASKDPSKDLFSSAVFSPDGTNIVTVSRDNGIQFWDATQGKLLRTIAEFEGSVLSAVLSPNGASILVTTKDKIVLLDRQNGMKKWEIVRNPLDFSSRQLAIFSPNGKIVLIPSMFEAFKIADATTGRILMKLGGDQDFIQSAVFSPNSKSILTVSRPMTNKKTLLWNVQAREQVLELKPEVPAVSATFSPNGDTIATGLENGSIILWNRS